MHQVDVLGDRENGMVVVATRPVQACQCLYTDVRFTMIQQVLVEDAQTLGPTGADRVQFVMEANQGQTRGAVDAVASSGEKSRLLLLLETRLPPPQARSRPELGRRTLEWDGEMVVEHDEAGRLSQAGIVGDASGGGGLARAAAPCAVLYDEIDAHVGGRTAVTVGKLLANQGRDSQVRRDIYSVWLA